jgi:hypothetical protein
MSPTTCVIAPTTSSGGSNAWVLSAPDNWLYIYLLIEFQSRVDSYMALRIMVYIAELIEPIPGSLATYRPSQKHFVLDEGRLDEAALPTDHNTLAEIIRLESSPGPEALRQIVSRLTQRMKDPRHDSLRRALVVWMHRVVLRKLIPGDNIPIVQDLQEIDTMLAERVVQWTEKWKQEGLLQGGNRGCSRVGKKAGKKAKKNCWSANSPADLAR